MWRIREGDVFTNAILAGRVENNYVDADWTEA